MSLYDHYDDQYDGFESNFDANDRHARRKRKPKARHVPKKAHAAIVENLTDEAAGGIETGFKTSYHPGLFEQGWLLESLRALFEEDLITDVLAQVKGGKEATVYRCRAHPRLGVPLVAAKVYRPRMFRNLRNDALYREGRRILKTGGGAVKENDLRTLRALDKGSGYAQELSHASWLMHEFATLQTLHAAGVPVPTPYRASENTILMGYLGDEGGAAPTLSEVKPPREEAPALFNEVIRSIDVMLQHGLIHGDLSAYNLLYWEGEVTLIDFPQVTHSHANGNAYAILARDVQRVCDYFGGLGVRQDAAALTYDLWKRYLARDPREVAADLSALTGEDE